VGSDGVPRLWVRELDSLEARPLHRAELNRLNSGIFFWSPDSRFIAFDAGGKLKRIEVSGSSPQTLCELSSMAIGGSWNRDGTIIFGSDSGGLRQATVHGPQDVPDYLARFTLISADQVG
jgi:hypothetical protein